MGLFNGRKTIMKTVFFYGEHYGSLVVEVTKAAQAAGLSFVDNGGDFKNHGDGTGHWDFKIVNGGKVSFEIFPNDGTWQVWVTVDAALSKDEIESIFNDAFNSLSKQGFRFRIS